MTDALNDLLSSIDDDVAGELKSTPDVVDKGDALDPSDLPIEARLWHKASDVVAVVSDLKSSTLLGLNKHAASAASVYEAMRAYWSDTDQQLYVFRLREHLRRLERSAKIARIPLPADAARLERETLEIIRANGLREDLHVRLIVFVDTDDGGLASREPVGYVIAPIPTTRYFETAGLHVGVSSWHRTADNAIPARVKAAANYQNSRLALLQAKTDGYDDAILLKRLGHHVAIFPGSYTNIKITTQEDLLIAEALLQASSQL